MMKSKNGLRSKSMRYFFRLCSFCLFLNSCEYNHVPENNKHIKLLWNNTQVNQTKDDFVTGVAWLFSYLGATLPKSDFEKAILFQDEKIILLQTEYLGFNESAASVMSKLIEVAKSTEEYQHQDWIDAGRFFALCFNSSYHYYQLTGVDKDFATFKSRFLASQTKQLAVDSSSIAAHSRLLNYQLSMSDIRSNFFFAEEGAGYFSSGTFVKSGAIEAFDYMANGQPRFAIYDLNGKLVPASSSIFSNAGKPSKCMWCHESKMQRLYRASPEIPGYISQAEFTSDQMSFNDFLINYHRKQVSFLDFSKVQAHTQGEYIYLSFFEPNSSRLAMEWGETEEHVKQRLSGIATHSNPEFSFLSNVYFRNEVDKLAPYPVVKVCDEAREPGGFEPDYCY